MWGSLLSRVGGMYVSSLSCVFSLCFMLPTRRGAAAFEHLASYVSVLLHLRPCLVLVGIGVDARACWCLCLVFCARV